MARPSPTTLPSVSVGNSPKSWFPPPCNSPLKRIRKHFKTRGTKHEPLPPPWSLKCPPISLRSIGHSLLAPYFSALGHEYLHPDPISYSFQRAQGWWEILKVRAVYIINIYIFFFYGKAGRWLSGLRVCPFYCLPPISAPGPSPSFHKKQSETRGSSTLFLQLLSWLNVKTGYILTNCLSQAGAAAGPVCLAQAPDRTLSLHLEFTF